MSDQLTPHEREVIAAYEREFRWRFVRRLKPGVTALATLAALALCAVTAFAVWLLADQLLALPAELVRMAAVSRG